jgi:adenine-specific DNA-methyltransferase
MTGNSQVPKDVLLANLRQLAPEIFTETKNQYQKRVGDKDEEGYMTREGMFRKNSRENGQYHSNWLNMMYPRLFLARNLLRDDGVIFVSIDDNEVHNLRLMMNEIFGEENFFSQIIVRTNSRGQTYKQIAKTHEYILIYTKSAETELFELEKDETNNDLNLQDDIGSFNIRELRNRNPKFGKHNRPNLFYPVFVNPNIKDKDDFYPVSLSESSEYCIKVEPYNSLGKESCWRWGKSKCLSNILNDSLKSNLVAKKKNDGSFGIYEKYRKTTFKPKSIWTDNSFLTETGTIEVKELGFDDEFDFPKPVSLIKQCIQLATESEDIVLDFFAGSGTTAQAVIELNKSNNDNIRFICVQLPETCDVSSGAFRSGYKTIADISKERIRRVLSSQKNDVKDTALKKVKQTVLGLDLGQNSIGWAQLETRKLESKTNNAIIDLGFKVFKLSESNFKIWRSQGIETAEELEKQMALFTDPVSENAATEPMVYELLLKSGFDLNSPVEHQNGAYHIGNGEMALLIETVSEKLIGEVIQSRPQKVIALDRLFEGNDQLKTNTALQMKDANIDFKTI